MPTVTVRLTSHDVITACLCSAAFRRV